MSDIIQVTLSCTVIPLEPTLAFFTSIFWDSKRTSAVESYAYVHRETAGSASSGNTVPDRALPGNRRFAHYVDVRDIDSLYPELKPKLDTPPIHGASTSPTANASFSSSLPTAT